MAELRTIDALKPILLHLGLPAEPPTVAPTPKRTLKCVDISNSGGLQLAVQVEILSRFDGCFLLRWGIYIRLFRDDTFLHRGDPFWACGAPNSTYSRFCAHIIGYPVL